MRLYEEHGHRLNLGLILFFLVVCFVGAMGFALWVDITLSRLALTLFYFLVVGPLTIAVAALIMKVLASAVLGWKISYSWLLVVTGFAFLAMQYLGQANRLVYASLWRFSGLLNLVFSFANILVFSAIVAVVLSLASGRSWRQSFLLTFIGSLGLGFLIFGATRVIGFRTPGFWPII